MSLHERLHELFEYRDGNLYWKTNRGSKKCKGKKAGCLTVQGYDQFRVRELGGAMKVHRAVYLMHHKYLPEFIDHINGNRSDNRIENLRSATKEENGQNRIMPSHNTSGVKNVSWMKNNKKWGVHLRINGKKRWFGLHDDLEFAELVAMEARNKYHGEYAKHD